MIHSPFIHRNSRPVYKEYSDINDFYKATAKALKDLAVSIKVIIDEMKITNEYLNFQTISIIYAVK